MDMLAKARAFVRRHKFYCVYVPLLWIVLLIAALLLVRGSALMPFLYRSI
jgi:hypothetical protein